MFLKLLHYCSGANPELLQLCPTDDNKYAGLGAAVIMTALLSFAAAGYVFYIMFRNWYPACILGGVWGLAVLFLDRLALSGLRKSGDWRTDVMHITPRFIIAVFLSWTIIRPLEIKLFEMEMFGPTAELEQAALDDIEERIRARYQLKIDILDLEIERIRNAIREKKPLDPSLLDDDPTMGGKEAKAYHKLLPDLERKRKAIIKAKAQAIDAHEKMLAIHDEDRFYRLNTKLKALSRLFEMNWFLNLMNLSLIGMFAAFKSAPLVMFLLADKSPYDELTEVHEEIAHYRDVKAMARARGRRKKR